MESHELASIFPMMVGEEYESLKADIKKNGLLEPIWTYQDKVIDGRNRFKACSEVEITPKYQEWDGVGSLIGFILSLNLRRRHLTASERAAIGAEIEPLFAEEAKKRQAEHGGTAPGKSKNTSGNNATSDTGKFRDQAALAVRVSGKLVSDAKAIKKDSPKIFNEVKSGKKTIAKAKKEIKQEKKEKERKKKAKEAKAVIQASDDYGIKHGDFKEIAKSIPDGSISLIFTDPPYDRKSLDLYEDLGIVAKRVLCDGGSLVTYFGQYQIKAVLDQLSNHLRYWWTLAVAHSGRSARMVEYGVVVQWKPLLWFVKNTRGDKNIFIEDLIYSTQEKTEHDWQQSIVEAKYCIEKLCPEYGLVFDPFCGGGTTAVAAKLLNRKWISCDIDDATVDLARKRVHDTNL
jgi:hypothetical protein